MELTWERYKVNPFLIGKLKKKLKMNCRANINVTLVFVFPSKSNEFLPSYFCDLFVALRF